MFKATYALYLMDGYSPRVEHNVAICSAILSIPALFSEALQEYNIRTT